jgi:hypothetical protein
MKKAVGSDDMGAFFRDVRKDSGNKALRRQCKCPVLVLFLMCVGDCDVFTVIPDYPSFGNRAPPDVPAHVFKNSVCVLIRVAGSGHRNESFIFRDTSWRTAFSRLIGQF